MVGSPASLFARMAVFDLCGVPFCRGAEVIDDAFKHMQNMIGSAPSECREIGRSSVLVCTCKPSDVMHLFLVSLPRTEHHLSPRVDISKSRLHALSDRIFTGILDEFRMRVVNLVDKVCK